MRADEPLRRGGLTVKKTIANKPKQLKISRQTVRKLSAGALDNVRGGDGSDPRYTSACAQSNRCLPFSH